MLFKNLPYTIFPPTSKQKQNEQILLLPTPTVAELSRDVAKRQAGDGAVEGGRLQTEWIYVHLQLIHINVWQKPIKHCKAIMLQLKILQKNLDKKNKYIKGMNSHPITSF